MGQKAVKYLRCHTLYFSSSGCSVYGPEETLIVIEVHLQGQKNTSNRAIQEILDIIQ